MISTSEVFIIISMCWILAGVVAGNPLMIFTGIAVGIITLLAVLGTCILKLLEISREADKGE